MSTPSDRDLARKLGEARMRLLKRTPFLTILLLQLHYGLDDNCQTACTDATNIVFGPDFLRSLSPLETEFILLHEVLHVALKHCFRGRERDVQRFNLACDIVVNATIREETGLTLPEDMLLGQKVLWQTPDGQSGAAFSAEEVYDMLARQDALREDASREDASRPEEPPGHSGTQGQDTGTQRKSRKKKRSDRTSEDTDDGKRDCGPSETRKKPASSQRSESENGSADPDDEDVTGDGGTEDFDDHSHWPSRCASCAENDRLESTWSTRLLQTAISIEERSSGRGTESLMADRILKKLRTPRLNWKALLYNFIRQEITDYTFMQPDRRFQDMDCILPGFYETRDPTAIFIAVDASGSISDQDLTDSVSEILGAVLDFSESVWISFFDTCLSEPVRCTSPYMQIHPVGGGGTDFACIFEYIRRPGKPMNPDCIVILTDGYAPFPDQREAAGIPVLWILNNTDVTPPWGRVIRMITEEPRAQRPGSPAGPGMHGRPF